MKTFKISAVSKNKNSIKAFLKFMIKFNNKNLKKYSQKQTWINKLTILKSPHVNKTAQEQFEAKLFKKQIHTQFIKSYRSLNFLKQLNSNLFPDITLKLQHQTNLKNFKHLGCDIFNPKNFKQKSFFYICSENQNFKQFSKFQKQTIFLKSLKRTSFKTTSLLKLLDLYGEFSKTMFE